MNKLSHNQSHKKSYKIDKMSPSKNSPSSTVLNFNFNLVEFHLIKKLFPLVIKYLLFKVKKANEVNYYLKLY
jgi:hypothetical protein